MLNQSSQYPCSIRPMWHPTCEIINALEQMSWRLLHKLLLLHSWYNNSQESHTKSPIFGVADHLPVANGASNCVHGIRSERNTSFLHAISFNEIESTYPHKVCMRSKFSIIYVTRVFSNKPGHIWLHIRSVRHFYSTLLHKCVDTHTYRPYVGIRYFQRGTFTTACMAFTWANIMWAFRQIAWQYICIYVLKHVHTHPGAY